MAENLNDLNKKLIKQNSTSALKNGFPYRRLYRGCLCTHTEKAMATHSTTLAWKIPWTEEPGGCRLWGCTESDMTEAT